jgi:hypothetical protein
MVIRKLNLSSYALGEFKDVLRSAFLPSSSTKKDDASKHTPTHRADGNLWLTRAPQWRNTNEETNAYNDGRSSYAVAADELGIGNF